MSEITQQLNIKQQIQSDREKAAKLNSKVQSELLEQARNQTQRSGPGSGPGSGSLFPNPQTPSEYNAFFNSVFEQIYENDQKVQQQYKAEAEAKAKVEAEAKAKVEAEAKAKAEAEALAKARDANMLELQIRMLNARTNALKMDMEKRIRSNSSITASRIKYFEFKRNIIRILESNTSSDSEKYTAIEKFLLGHVYQTLTADINSRTSLSHRDLNSILIGFAYESENIVFDEIIEAISDFITAMTKGKSEIAPEMDPIIEKVAHQIVSNYMLQICDEIDMQNTKTEQLKNKIVFQMQKCASEHDKLKQIICILLE